MQNQWLPDVFFSDAATGKFFLHAEKRKKEQ